MINSYAIHTDELFIWIDDFIRITGLPINAALQIYAECCYFQSANIMLARLLSIEAEFDLRLQSCEPNEDGDRDTDGEVFLEHYAEYQLCLSDLSEEDAKLFSEHYKKVLLHHGFIKQFHSYFIEHFHPLSEYLTSDSPIIDKRFIIKNQYKFTPFFTGPPDAPSYVWLSVIDRLEEEPPVDPAGWAAVFKKLGFHGFDGNFDPHFPAYEPVMFVGPTIDDVRALCKEVGVEFEVAVDAFDFSDSFEETPIFITPFSVPGPGTIHFGMYELHAEIQQDYDTAIVLYSAPYILRAPDKKKFISVWGEILHDEKWMALPLHANSTSIERIIEDAFSLGSEPNWQNIATPDLPLVELWKSHHRPPKTSFPATNKSEVISFNPLKDDD